MIRFRCKDSYGREWIALGVRDVKGYVEVALRHPKKKYVRYVEYDKFVKAYTKMEDINGG